jgi:hypothetical protein
MSEGADQKAGSVLLGLGLTLVLHAVALALCVGISTLLRDDAKAGFIPFLFIGVLQALWIWPACMLAAHFKRRRTLDGLGIGAALTLLLNSVCFGIVLSGALSI